VPETDSSQDIQVFENGGKAPTIKGLTVRSVFTEEQALGLLFEGEINRSISENALNMRSSRAHCIFSIHVEVCG
jgi:kinesin family protein 6/9